MQIFNLAIYTAHLFTYMYIGKRYLELVITHFIIHQNNMIVKESDNLDIIYN